MQVADGAAGFGGGAGVAGGKVQCPIAACSGVQVEDGAAGFGGGGGADGKVQCPIAACSGKHVVCGAGVAGWEWPLCCPSAGVAAPANNRGSSALMRQLLPGAGL